MPNNTQVAPKMHTSDDNMEPTWCHKVPKWNRKFQTCYTSLNLVEAQKTLQILYKDKHEYIRKGSRGCQTTPKWHPKRAKMHPSDDNMEPTWRQKVPK